MERFFQALENPVGNIRFEEIIPSASTGEITKERAVYVSYIDAIGQTEIDQLLRPYRNKSLEGGLKPGDFQYLDLEVLEKAWEKARDAGTKKAAAFNKVKSHAMLIAQILFVNNGVNEGLPDIIAPEEKKTVLKELQAYIKEKAMENGSPLEEQEACFYANLFLLQTLFDKNFVPDEDIVQYKGNRGQYDITGHYGRATLYLTLTNKRVIEASHEEKKLCYNISTGWSRGIDSASWNQLNQWYYGEISPTTGKKNLFVANYNKMLDRMLPQFAFSKVRLAEEVLKREYGEKGLKIVEIGAGTGTFAIDLFNACLRMNIDTNSVEYLGLEPNENMTEKFEENMAAKLGSATLPKDWKLLPGDLESVTQNPPLSPKGQRVVFVLCYSGHHCFAGSVENFFKAFETTEKVKTIYFLDVVKEHGWTKPFYMWVDCESPENFDNVTKKGNRHAETLWLEPSTPIEGHALTNAWCSLRMLTPSGA